MKKEYFIKSLIAVSVLLALGACQKNTPLKLLTGYGWKYWICTHEPRHMEKDSIYEYSDSTKIIVNYLYFDKYGTCVLFESSDRYFMNEIDFTVDINRTWHFVNDSTIKIQGYISKIKKMTPNEILLYDSINNLTDTLRPLKRWYVPQKFRKYQPRVRELKEDEYDFKDILYM